MSFRTSLIVLNVVAFVVIAGFIIWRVFSLRRNPEREDAGEPGQFLPDEDLEGRRLERVLGWSLHLRDDRGASRCPSTSSSSRAGRSSADEAFLERSIERGADALREQAEPGVRRRRSRCCARTATASRARAAPRRSCSSPRPTSASTSRTRATPTCPECLPKQVHVGGARARHRAAALRQEQAHPDHHVRPAGHADARVGRRERQGRAQRAGHQRPRQLHREHPDHARRRRRASRRRQCPSTAKAATQLVDDQRTRRSRRRRGRPRRGAGRPVDRAPADAGRSSRPRSTTAQAAARGRARPTTPRSQRLVGRRDPLPPQLRPLPHQGLVVLRPDEPRRSRRSRRRAAARTARACATARPLLQFPGEAGDAGAVRLGRRRRAREQPVRRPRDLVGPHAALRPAADRRRRSQRSSRTSAASNERRDRAREPAASSPPRRCDKDIWYPTILGILVVVFAIVLFCGSLYLLLAHEHGRAARLPRRVHLPHGLHGPAHLALDHHRVAAQHAQGPHPGVEGGRGRQGPVQGEDRPRSATSRRTATRSTPIEAANVKAAADENLIQVEAIPSAGRRSLSRRSPRFQAVTDYKVLKTYEIGGSKPNPLDFELTHTPLFAVDRVLRGRHERRARRAVRDRAADLRSASRTIPTTASSSSSATSDRCACRRSSRSSRRCCCSVSVCSHCTGARRTSARPRRPRRAPKRRRPAVPEKV